MLKFLKLVKYLDKYAETGKEYVKILQKIIEQNKLTEHFITIFDDNFKFTVKGGN